jgi:hypothetical protein
MAAREACVSDGSPQRQRHIDELAAVTASRFEQFILHCIKSIRLVHRCMLHGSIATIARL